MRLRTVFSVTRHELATVRDVARAHGGRVALVSRVRHHFGIDDEVRRIAELEARVGALEEAATTQSVSTAELRTVLGHHGKALEDRRLDAVHAGELADRSNRALDGRLDELLRLTKVEDLAAQIAPVTMWVRDVELVDRPLVSVVLPTRDRPALLERAVASVRAQEYGNWELVVAADGGSPDTHRVMDRLAAEDKRIRVVRIEASGQAVVRNAALDAATGELVCYLDDDNTLEPLWLKAVVWAFGREPGTAVLYGARVADVEPGARQFGLPYVQLEPFDRARLEVGNYIDMGAVAHRSGLPEAQFDPALHAHVDWDLILRLTENCEPLVLPVVSTVYRTDAPDRVTRLHDYGASESAARVRMLRRRPLRVLAYNALFPLVTETYIPDEMRALTANGFTLAWCTVHPSDSPVEVEEPTYADLDEAVRRADPDVLVLFWATFAIEQLADLERIGRPFAVRVHSFDFERSTVERLRNHPLCIGVWAYPHLAATVDGVYPLVSLLTTRGPAPEPGHERTVVLSASAGLPKKDWPVLVGAFAELARSGADCRIIVGRTHQHHDELDVLRGLIAESGAPVSLAVDVPHDEVLAQLADTALVVYTHTSGDYPFGMPRSIIEGMHAGTSVLLPDRSEAELTAGPGCRTYVGADDIVRHGKEVLAGGPTVEAESSANRRFAEEHFADPALATRFATDLAGALARWRAR
jgi:glycosyltransferase involved in cell wall biosynthesis